MRKIYCVGNALLREDRMPLRIMGKLQNKFPKMEFCELDPSENMPEDKNLTIIDTVVGIDKVEIIRDINHVVTGRVYSLHDFDLGFTLKLMKKAGKLEKIRIIGVPAHMNEKTAIGEVGKAVQKIMKEK